MTTTTLSENIPFVTKHRYKYRDTLITLGWDSARQGYFLIIRKDGDEWKPCWSSEDQPTPYQPSLTPFLRLLKQFDLHVPATMVQELKMDWKVGRNTIKWHLDRPHAPTYDMTHHHFYTKNRDDLVHVHMGWNRTLEGFFLMIEKEGETKELLWSNMDQRNRRYHYPQSLDLFLNILDDFEITIPRPLIEKVLDDRELYEITKVIHQAALPIKIPLIN